MHFTRRLLERRRSAAFGLLVLAVSTAGATSCSTSEDGGGPLPSPDAAASDAGADAVPVDAGPDRDAAPFDGGLLPVTCTSDPCVTSLVTTRGAAASERDEGFCALLRDGTVACWGAGAAGQLGRGDDADAVDSATPARVVGLTKVASLDHTCAVDDTGGVHCWGTGPFLRSTESATTTERTPVQLGLPIVTKVAVGALAGCALSAGSVLCWGANRYGQVAPFEIERSSAVLEPRAIELSSGSPVRDLVVGDAAFVVHADGTMTSWGANPPLGRVSSLFPDPYPAPVAITNLMAVDVADNNGCATSEGGGFCWGFDGVAPPEQGSEPPHLQRALPVRVVAAEPLVQIATIPIPVPSDPGSPAPPPPRWCAVTASGAVVCQGSNASGQAGDGTRAYAQDAHRVIGLPGPAREVKTTPESTCALLTSGKVYCWGGNFFGQLGNRAIKVASLTPQEVQLP
jgi:Regulator of chromosome condensation (RCC1) repeat